MDAPHERDGALLRDIVSKGSNLAARSVRRSDQERGNYRMVRLLRWNDLTPHGPGCAFYRSGRVLSDNPTSLRVPRPGHLLASCNAMRRLRSGCGRCIVRIIDIDIIHWIYFHEAHIEFVIRVDDGTASIRQKEKRFRAKTALVAGASGGIGSSIAKRLAKDGFSVVVHYAGKT